MKPVVLIQQVLFGLILGLFIISSSVVISLNFRPLYYADMQLLHISEWSGYSDAEIRQNYDALIDYNQLFNKEPLNFPTMTMSEGGRIHFEEVKVIFDLFGYMAIVTFFLVIAIVIYNHLKKRWLYLAIAGCADILIPAVLGILVAINWDWFFVTFHHIAFDNDFWIFDYATDPVILILPDTFFMHSAIMIFALIIAASILLLLISRIKALEGKLRKTQA